MFRLVTPDTVFTLAWSAKENHDMQARPLLKVLSLNCGCQLCFNSLLASSDRLLFVVSDGVNLLPIISRRKNVDVDRNASHHHSKPNSRTTL